MLYALRPFPLRRRLINICNPSQNAATTRSERTLHNCCEFISFDPISSPLLLSRSPFVSCCAPVRLVIPAVNSSVDPVATAAILNHVSIYVVTRDLRFLLPLPPGICIETVAARSLDLGLEEVWQSWLKCNTRQPP